MGFVHLHNRSGFSLLDGVLTPQELASRAAALGMPAVALTDTCNLYGAIEFYKACKGAGVQPVFGASLWVWPDGLDRLDARKPDGGWEIVLLVEAGPDDPRRGFRNLSRLVTTAIFEGMHYRPRVDWRLLEAHKAGLIALTSGLNGPLGQRDPDRARADLARLADIFGKDHLFVELSDYGIPGQPEQNDRARRLAGELGLHTVITNDCRYLEPTDAVTLDLLNCVARSSQVDDPEREPLCTDQQYLKSEEEMRALFPDDLNPGDGAAMDRTVDIARRCVFKPHIAPPYFFPATDPPDPHPPAPPDTPRSKAPRADTDANWTYFYRAFPPPRDFGLPGPDEAVPPRPPGAGSLEGYFEWYASKGLELRLRDVPADRHEEYRDRLRFELDVIEDMQFPAYLLIVAEFINWAKDNGIPVGPGRGSGAGAVVNYALRITDIDPLRFGLLMERFLNPERVSMPDIDVDFCQDRREEVIAHVRDKYGADRVSQIITYGKLQAKAALKDVARVLGVDFTSADRIAKLVPEELGITLDKALEEERLARLAAGDPIVGRIVTLARRVEGMLRQTGVHAAGVVIADRPLVDHAPLYRDGPEGGPVVQFDMKSAETVGLIKFDFLGLKTLDQIREAVTMVERNTGERIDISRLPLDDEATFKLLQRGDALGVFQVESSGMRDLLRRLKPSNVDDLIALLALYRPGPLSSGMVDSFIDCKHGRKRIEYPHPDLEPILAPTYGSIVYQEQVMQIAQVYAGYTLGGADLLRRAMGKKKPEEMAKQKGIFVSGATALGRAEKEASDLFDLLAFFAGYGFNKSHSAAYGIVSYQTAWLKAHHRAEYMAALMTIEANNTPKVLVYIGDCKRAGIQVLPPDVNQSQLAFDVPKKNRRQIRFGLGAVKGVGTGAVDAILEARREGPFKGFLDFLERVDGKRINRKVVESLVKCGAFDWTGQERRRLFDGMETAMKAAQRTQEDRASGQTSLFGRLAAAAPARIQLPDVGEWPTAVKLGMEREALGFFITGHPVEAYKGIIRRAATCTVAALAEQTADKTVTVAGMVTALRVIRTRRGDRMAFVTIEDLTEAVECTFLPEPWSLNNAALTADQPVLVTGKLEKSDDGVKILAESAELLSAVRERRTKAVHIAVSAEELPRATVGSGQTTGDRVDELLTILKSSRGNCPVHLHVRFPGEGWATYALPEDLAVVPDDALMQALETCFRRPDAARLA